MAQDQEYLTGNRKTRYPFADDSVLSVDDEKAIAVFSCFVDAMVQLKSPYSEAVPRITGISIDDPTLSFSLVDASGHGDPVDLTCSKSRTRFPVIKGETDWCWYVFVMSSDGIQEFCDAKESDPELDVSEDSVALADRCLGRSAAMVSSIQVYGGEQEPYEGAGRRCTRLEAMALGPDFSVTGDVGFKAGNNMRIGQGSAYASLAGLDSNDSISLNAEPGAGEGRLPCECPEVTTFRTPGLIGEGGHLRLFNDRCYDLVPMLYSPKKAYLRMHVKCKACCTCEMYAAIVKERLVPLKDTILAAKGSLDGTFATYEENVAKWNKRIQTALPEDIAVSVTAVPLDAAGTKLRKGEVFGKMNRCGFSVMVRNDSFVTVDITLSDLLANGDVFEAQASYMDENLTPKIIPVSTPFTVGNITLPAGRSMTFTCFIRPNNMVRTGSRRGFSASVKITAKQGDRLIFARTKGVSV